MHDGKYSRDKGVRGERTIAKRLGGKRVGIAFLTNPVDVDLGWAVAQIKNRSLGGSAILAALNKMEAVTKKGKNRYVIFKPSHGKWLVAETLEQFEGDHGKLPEEKLEA